jgi:hypothetical protein
MLDKDRHTVNSKIFTKQNKISDVSFVPTYPPLIEMLHCVTMHVPLYFFKVLTWQLSVPVFIKHGEFNQYSFKVHV